MSAELPSVSKSGVTSLQLGDSRRDSAATPSSASLRTESLPQWRYELSTVRVLWQRDITRFFRQKSRVLGALVQPLLFWAIIGNGFSSSFRIEGLSELNYARYFYPGIVLLVILFSSIFATMSLIEDRHQGFLQAVLAAPGSRTAVVLGKTLGGTTIAMLQALAMVLLARVAGYSFLEIDWLPLVAALALTSLLLTSLGFAVAWVLDSVQGYHAVMSVLLLPLWILSGAMFPGNSLPGFLSVAMKLNPLSYAALAVRRALSNGVLPQALSQGSSKWLELGVVFASCCTCLVLAAVVARKRG